MPFNENYCKVICIGYKNPESEYSLKVTPLESTDSEKDLDVIISSEIRFSKQGGEERPKNIKLYEEAVWMSKQGDCSLFM